MSKGEKGVSMLNRLFFGHICCWISRFQDEVMSFWFENLVQEREFHRQWEQLCCFLRHIFKLGPAGTCVILVKHPKIR